MTQRHPALIILNGKSAGNESVRDAITASRNAGETLHVRVTWEHGDAARYVAEAISLGVGTVIAAGGDGTVNEVSGALFNHSGHDKPTLGIIPLGTANDFATACRIPAAPDVALNLALHARAVPVDLVRVNRTHFFINMATGGFGTRITTETPEKLKAALGGASYFLHGLLRLDTLKPDFCKVSGPDFTWQGNALVVGVGNGRQAGGGQPMCPDALLNDGRIQLRILAADELLPSLLEGLLNGEQSKNIINAELPWLEIETPHDVMLNLDGEPLSGSHFRFDVEPGAITCRLPPDCPLLA
ncbi:lipid kinase YegS [Enterobacillus tribolii]|uniref:Probable lipid kinase YegS-like n=1 Tax=Enterobacillus tribolii TaxID=1487935 RepID=A0A370QS28_9GAMM|nr:lipid kinase YegS [Enterobacillus tribolii]MBW7983709.1 lipid kinase YegS [Enterobacillus tribolii]RDK92072.1 lipid kinase YegS [Enterobacillus tribolii]